MDSRSSVPLGLSLATPSGLLVLVFLVLARQGPPPATPGEGPAPPAPVTDVRERTAVPQTLTLDVTPVLHTLADALHRDRALLVHAWAPDVLLRQHLPHWKTGGFRRHKDVEGLVRNWHVDQSRDTGAAGVGAYREALMRDLERFIKEKCPEPDDVLRLVGYLKRGWRPLEQILRSAGTIEWTIVTVPDHVTSSVDWMFDEVVAAIVAAEDDQHFELVARHIPELAFAQERKNALAEQHLRTPGLLLFRDRAGRPDGFRALLLVPETPAGLAAPASLATAVRLVAAATSATTLHLVGPTFSGTAYALGRVVAETIANLPGRDRPAEVVVRVSSATATVAENDIRTGYKAGAGAGTPGIAVHAEVKDRTLRSLLDDVVRGPGAGGPGENLDRGEGETANRVKGRTLELSEMSAFAFGKSSERTEARTLIRFPRHLSQLAAAGSQPANGGVPWWTARVGLPPPGVSHLQRDGVSSASPPMRAAILEQTWRQQLAGLSATQYDRVHVVATDVRDLLFVAQEVRATLGDLPITTTEFHTLMLHPRHLPYVRGMLLASASVPAIPAATASSCGTSLPCAGPFDSMIASLAYRGVYKRHARLPDRSEGLTPRPDACTLRKNAALMVVGRGRIFPLTTVDGLPAPGVPRWIAVASWSGLMGAVAIVLLSLLVTNAAWVQKWVDHHPDALGELDAEREALGGARWTAWRAWWPVWAVRRAHVRLRHLQLWTHRLLIGAPGEADWIGGLRLLVVRDARQVLLVALLVATCVVVPLSVVHLTVSGPNQLDLQPNRLALPLAGWLQPIAGWYVLAIGGLSAALIVGARPRWTPGVEHGPGSFTGSALSALLVNLLGLTGAVIALATLWNAVSVRPLVNWRFEHHADVGSLLSPLPLVWSVVLAAGVMILWRLRLEAQQTHRYADWLRTRAGEALFGSPSTTMASVAKAASWRDNATLWHVLVPLGAVAALAVVTELVVVEHTAPTARIATVDGRAWAAVAGLLPVLAFWAATVVLVDSGLAYVRLRTALVDLHDQHAVRHFEGVRTDDASHTGWNLTLAATRESTLVRTLASVGFIGNRTPGETQATLAAESATWEQASRAATALRSIDHPLAPKLAAVLLGFPLRDGISRIVSGATVSIVMIVLVLCGLSLTTFHGREALIAMGLWILTGAGIVTSIILIQLERDPVVSSLLGTKPGRITWSGTLVRHLAVTVVLPLIVFIGAAFPELGGTWMGWMESLRVALGVR